jgi:hypothetical protein
LDIGIGYGRTSAALLDTVPPESSASYCGVCEKTLLSCGGTSASEAASGGVGGNSLADTASRADEIRLGRRAYTIALET